MWTAFWGFVGLSASTLLAALPLDADKALQRHLFFAAEIFLVLAIASLVVGFFRRWLRLRPRPQPGAISIDREQAFDTRRPSPRQGIIHLCRVSIRNRSGTLLTNTQVKIVNLMPAHHGNHNFQLRGDITLADNESLMVNIATHVEGVPDSARLMSLQLPVRGGFTMPAGYGIVEGEQRFQLRVVREDTMLHEISCRLFVNDLNVMHLELVD